MEIRRINTRTSRASKSSASIPASQINKTAPVQPITNFDSSQLEYVDPAQHGPIAQLINNSYQAQRKKQAKRMYLGKQLKAILARAYNFAEFKRLPRSVKNLIRFDKNIITAEVTQLTEYMNSEHEIAFKDYEFESSKFRAIFESWGELKDVQMKAGLNHYASLSEHFPIKRRIQDLFTRIRQRMLLRKRQRNRLKLQKREPATDRESI